ncbi:hypothetical protein M408DRAFT_29069 [Serendipita vermifera MAFF 305830]|uniref:Uncharacterized protein n=1 Tax=Serendipita vermifera MAFF 305830 TaxID=933852 RepID=A0A0C2WXI7_SERVB|nr:hypothetical protein M408DRAFT_29069 [Serendipita vermifera MAFF 305830]
MATFDVPSRPINEYLTADQAALIRKTISSRQNELNATIKLIEEEKFQSDVLASTILQLQKTNKSAKSAHKSLEEYLNQSLQLKGDHKSSNMVVEVPHMHGPYMETAANEILNLTGDEIISQAKDLTQDISTIKQKLSKLRIYIQKTEMEIYWAKGRRH